MQVVINESEMLHRVAHEQKSKVDISSITHSDRQNSAGTGETKVGRVAAA